MRKGCLSLCIAFLTATAALTSCVTPTASAHAAAQRAQSEFRKTGIEFIEFVPSPDGHLIAFEYRDNSFPPKDENSQDYRVGLGLYDWQTGQLTRIPNPVGKQLSEPSFSDDGIRLLVSDGVVGSALPHQIDVVDLATMQVTVLSPFTSGSKQYPVFQPATGNVLYVAAADWKQHKLVLLNPSTHTEQTALDAAHGFIGTILRPSFVAQNRIVFQASAPIDSNLNREVPLLSTLIAYQLDFGSSPQILSLDAEQHTFMNDPNGAFYRLSATQNGRVLSYISNNPVNQQSHTFNPEIFKIENGQTSQLTNSAFYKDGANIAYDGSIISFAADPNSKGKSDLFIYIMATGKILPVNLLERIVHDPAFQVDQTHLGSKLGSKEN